MIFASKDCFISRPKWITLKLCQTRAKGKKNVCTRAHVLPFRRARASRALGASQMAEVRKIRLIVIIYYILANMANIPWPLQMHLGCRRAKENLSRGMMFWFLWDDQKLAPFWILTIAFRAREPGTKCLTDAQIKQKPP